MITHRSHRRCQVLGSTEVVSHPTADLPATEVIARSTVAAFGRTEVHLPATANSRATEVASVSTLPINIPPK